MVRNPTLAAFGLLALAPLASPLPRFVGQADSIGQTLAQRPVAFAGVVFDRHGAPAEGAVVVSSAGGRTVTDPGGRYRLEVRVPSAAQGVWITALGQEQGMVASARIEPSAGSPSVWVPPLELTLEGACSPAWLPTFGSAPGTNRPIQALAVFDDGNGPALYAGGSFQLVGGASATGLARWDGTSWTDVAGSVVHVLALQVFDDGCGPALYVGGNFENIGGIAASSIARWDGSSWANLGKGVDGSVEALAVFDDGSGPALHAGGGFTMAGSVGANHVAKWTGTNWRALGSGASGPVRALTVFDDGSGPALHAAGRFTVVGGVAAPFIAKWDGSRWSSLGSGMGPDTGTTIVESLTVFDDGRGPALYAGGSFATAGGSTAEGIARWDGASWTPVGSGVSPVLLPYGVFAMSVFDDGDGPALYAGGRFGSAGGVSARSIARWDGSSWTALGSGIGDSSSRVDALAVFDDGSGPTLFAAGSFASAGGAEADNIAKWQRSSWTALTKSGVGGPVNALATFDDGRGPALYAGGEFLDVPGVAASRIARWNGSSWEALGSGLNDEVLALTAFDDGSGPALYAAGPFTTAGGGAASFVARWDGASWSALDAGWLALSESVRALAVFDDGAGPALYAGGDFRTAGGRNIARWDGSSWVAVGGGIFAEVLALEVFDDGSGPALYAGHRSTTAGGTTGSVPARYIAKWDGWRWTALGSGLSSRPFALESYDDGSGIALYVGGEFDLAGGVAANAIAKWDGSVWSAVGGGFGGPGDRVLALRVFDDGCGPALYAAGRFATVGGVAASNIARWDGSSWTPLGGGVSSIGVGTSTDVRALTTFDDGTGTALHAGGNFLVSDARDRYLAMWGSPDRTKRAITDPFPRR
jgi:hypothetical protein